MIKLINILSEIKVISKITPELIVKESNYIFMGGFLNSDDELNEWINIFYKNGINKSAIFNDLNSYQNLSQKQLNNIYQEILNFKAKYNYK